MLHCSMITNPLRAQLDLEAVLGDLLHARRRGDLGRLALLAYCDVRRWARQVGEQELAQHSLELFTDHTHATRGEFLHGVDDLIEELEGVCSRWTSEQRSPAGCSGSPSASCDR